jgi:hypothetical protein
LVETTVLDPAVRAFALFLRAAWSNTDQIGEEKAGIQP